MVELGELVVDMIWILCNSGVESGVAREDWELRLLRFINEKKDVLKIIKCKYDNMLGVYIIIKKKAMNRSERRCK